MLLLRDQSRRWLCTFVLTLRLPRGDAVRDVFRGEPASRWRKRGRPNEEDAPAGLGTLRLNDILLVLSVPCCIKHLAI